MADAYSVTLEPEIRKRVWSSKDLLFEHGLQRDNDDNDELFYAAARKRPFFDKRTDEALRKHFQRILPNGTQRVLDLGSSITSHLPALTDCEVIGLGLNEQEMRRNAALTSIRVHNLNQNPRLPFEDESFDAVVSTGTMDQLLHPLEITREVARVLRKGGVFILAFTDRTVMPKSVSAWRDEENEGRLVLATAFFTFSGSFLRPNVEVEELRAPACVMHGPGATHGDDVLSVVWGYKPPIDETVKPHADKLERRPVSTERHCPFCGEQMSLWQPPETPWEIDYNATLLYVCFNDECDYFQRGKRWCRRNGMRCATYRHSRNPTNGAEGPLPVPTKWALRAGIVEET